MWCWLRQPHGPQGHQCGAGRGHAGWPSAFCGGQHRESFLLVGLQAIAIAAHQIIHESVDAVIGGGVESISMAVRDSSPNPRLQETMPGVYMVMGDTAEVVAKRYKVSRQVQDELLAAQPASAPPARSRKAFSTKRSRPSR